MNGRHLPYNILLVITIASVTLMAVSSLWLRRSSFPVRLGYAIPQPAAPEASLPPPVAPVSQPDPLPQSYPGLFHGEDQEPEPDETLSVQFPINLNQATYGQLLFIPGIGDATAQRILQYREQLDGYTSLSQLLDIHGIGESTYLRITAYLHLDEEEEGPPPNSGESHDYDDYDDFDDHDDYYDEWEEP